MTTTNPMGSLDGTTVTITLTGEHAQRAAAAVGYMVGTEMEYYPDTWNLPDAVTVTMLERHVADLQAIVDRYKPAMLQFEKQGVVDIWTAHHRAYVRACEAAGVGVASRASVDINPDPDPPTPGDVTLTWSTDELERLAGQLTDERHRKDYPDWIEAGEAIREQLEATR